MSALSHLMHWWDFACHVFGILAVAIHCFMRGEENIIGRRLSRGVYWRWIMKTFGFIRDLPIYLGGVMFAFVYDWTMDSNLGYDSFVSFLVVCLVVDWVTGSEDPPWRRWAKSLSERIKLVIQPPPKPAIQV